MEVSCWDEGWGGCWNETESCLIMLDVFANYRAEEEVEIMV